MGVLAARQGQLGDAEARLKESVAIREATSAPEPKYLADTLHELGAVYARTDRTSEARELFTRALEIRREVLAAGHPDIRLTETALASLDDLLVSGTR